MEYGEEVFASREEKVMAAKMAFSTEYDRKKCSQGMGGLREKNQIREERKHRFGLWRMIMTVMLFFTFMAAFHFQVSYRGWDEQRIEQVLTDDTKWQKVVAEVSKVVEKIEQRK